MAYLARTKDESSQIYLTKDIQMDTYLELGCNIYFENKEDQTETLVATPEEGFLTERPVFPKPETVTLGNSEMEQAAKILLGMED